MRTEEAWRVVQLTEALEARAGNNAELRRKLTTLVSRLADLEDDWRCVPGKSSMHEEARMECADELRDLLATFHSGEPPAGMSAT